MRKLNLGILAHVDAGKTTLTERLLYAAGVIDEIGSVDDGSTQTDTLALERERGITIKSAVVSFVVDDVTVNLIDTPGHPDFIAEVERVLNVLDGAVLVISAVEGVQAQTRVLMRTLQRLHIPTLIFVNKIDRAGADDEVVLRSISEKLTPAIVAMGSTRDLGTPAQRLHPVWRDRWCICRQPGGRTRGAERCPARGVRERRPRSSVFTVASTSSRRRPSRRWCIRSSSALPSRVRACLRSWPASPSCYPPPKATSMARCPAVSSRSTEVPLASASRTSGCSQARSARGIVSTTPGR